MPHTRVIALLAARSSPGRSKSAQFRQTIARVSSELLSPRIKIDILWNRDGRARRMDAEHPSRCHSFNDVGKPKRRRAKLTSDFNYDLRVSHE